MGMVLLFLLVAYGALVIAPASIAVLLLLWKSGRSRDFWISGAVSTIIAVIVIFLLNPPLESIPQTPLGPSITKFGTLATSQVSKGLGGMAIASFVFSVITCFKQQWHLVKGLSVGICAASWLWLLLMFKAD